MLVKVKILYAAADAVEALLPACGQVVEGELWSVDYPTTRQNARGVDIPLNTLLELGVTLSEIRPHLEEGRTLFLSFGNGQYLTTAKAKLLPRGGMA